MESSEYALLRTKARLACENALGKRLFDVARQIVLLSSKYTIGGKRINESSFLAEAKKLTGTLVDKVEDDIATYSLLSCSKLNIASDSIKDFLASEVFGKTSRSRTAFYLGCFAEDVVKMTKAGFLMGYSTDKILSAVRTGYKNPYVTSIITKARKKEADISLPSYGRGVNLSAYKNLVRNAQEMIAMAWGRAEQQYGKEHGAIGFLSFRGSSFPCAFCDDETTYVHKLGDPYPPYHPRCVCCIQFLYDNDNETE